MRHFRTILAAGLGAATIGATSTPAHADDADVILRLLNGVIVHGHIVPSRDFHGRRWNDDDDDAYRRGWHDDDDDGYRGRRWNDDDDDDDGGRFGANDDDDNGGSHDDDDDDGGYDDDDD